MLFTSIPSRPNVPTPQIFRDKGNPTDIPAPVSDTAITAVRSSYTIAYVAFVGNLGLHIASFLSGKVVASSNPFVNVAEIEAPSSLLPDPPVGVSFSKSNNPNLVDALTDMGFTKESIGRNSYYRGTLKESDIPKVLKLGANLDAATPLGVTTIKGVITLGILNRLIFGIYGSIKKSAFVNGADNLEWRSTFDQATGAYAAHPSKGKQQKARIVSDPDEVSTGGIFLPYYEGLVLPDKLIGYEFVSRRAFTCLGSDADKANATMMILRSGWRSLSATKTGMCMSHMIYAISLALDAGARPIPVIKQGQIYQGTILGGATLAVYKGPTCHKSLPLADLRKEIKEFDAHAEALENICNILNGLPLEDSDQDRVAWTPGHFTTPRKLHYGILRHKMNSVQQAQVRGELHRLSYVQEYLSATKYENLNATIEHIGNNRFPPDSWPIPYKNNVMFTRDKTMSILSAFGTKVPSISMQGGNKALVIPVPGKQPSLLRITEQTSKKDKTQRVILPGIPVYVVSLEKAVVLWNLLKKTCTLSFSKNAKGELIQATKVFAGHTSQAIGMETNLAKLFSASPSGTTSTERKRKRDEVDESGPSKKVVKVSDNQHVLAMYGVTQHEATGDESDNEIAPEVETDQENMQDDEE